MRGGERKGLGGGDLRNGAFLSFEVWGFGYGGRWDGWLM